MSERSAIDIFLKHNPDWIPYADLVALPPNREDMAEYTDMGDDFLERMNQTVNPGVTRGALYVRMRRSGESHKMAEMLALQRGAGVVTDDTFFSGQKPLYDQFGSQKALDRYLEASRKNYGYTPPVNATYFPNLARRRGDPEAYVTRAQGRSYIKKLLEKRGWGCEGGVNAVAREPENDPHDVTPTLAPDIVNNYARKMIKQDPSLKGMDRRELREKIIAKHGPKS